MFRSKTKRPDGKLSQYSRFEKKYELGMWLAMWDTWEIAKERCIELKGKVEIDGYYCGGNLVVSKLGLEK